MSGSRDIRNAGGREQPAAASIDSPIRQSALDLTLEFVASVYGAPLAAFDVERARRRRLAELVPGRVAVERLEATAGDATTAACLALMDHLPFSVAITDAAARILLANRPALLAIQAKDMMGAIDGMIVAIEPAARESLRSAIRRLCAGDIRPDYPVVVVPIAAGASWPHAVVVALQGGCEASCAAVIFPDRGRLNGAAHMLGSLFALTPAQTRLAVLMLEGETIDHAAAALHVTPRTAAETWKTVQSKLRTRSDEECIRLLRAAIVAVDGRTT